MSRLTTLTGVAVLLLAATVATAHTPSQPPHQLFNEGDLKLESGEVIKDFSISYVTHGTLNAKNRMRFWWSLRSAAIITGSIS